MRSDHLAPDNSIAANTERSLEQVCPPHQYILLAFDHDYLQFFTYIPAAHIILNGEYGLHPASDL
jgi:hypothetical protein